MPNNKIGQIPEFASEEGAEEEVKQTTQEVVEETETPSDPPA